MADLTILGSSNPLYPSLSDYASSSGSKSTNYLARLSRARLPQSPSTPSLPRSPSPHAGNPPQYLSPPRNTFKSNAQRHRRQRSSSAPPPLSLPPTPNPAPPPRPSPASPTSAYTRAIPRHSTRGVPEHPSTAPISRKSHSLPLPPPSSYLGSNPRTGTLLPPPPPLFRPTPFWRHQPRASSPTSPHHLVRRATFVAAGMELNKPYGDLSALGVEMRMGKAGVSVVLLPT